MTTCPPYLLSIDFGSACIRVAKTRLDQPDTLLPQLVEFNGERHLTNAILLTSDLTGYEEVGQDVYTSGMAETPEQIVSALSLDEPDEPRATALRHLLEYISQTLELEHVSNEERATWKTLVAAQSQEGAQWEAALKAANFPASQTLPAALAVMCGTLNSVPSPGQYLVIDCGADYTRMALCRVEASQTTILASRYGRPGGRDFDRALTHHFSQVLANSTVLSSTQRLELAHFVEEFKKTFAQGWAQGDTGIEYVYPVPSEQVVLSLKQEDFVASTLAGELIAEFRNLAERLLTPYASSPLDGIFLAGGGAHWPFVMEWAVQKVGQEKVYRSEYPEEALVRGLPFLAMSGIRMVDAPATPRLPHAQPPQVPPNPPARPAPPTGQPRPVTSPPSPSPRPRMDPWTVFGLEFFGGIFGFMGLGWFFGVKNLPLGCGGLLGWWVILAGLIALGVAAFVNPLLFLCVIPVWLGGPLLSAILAYRAQKKATL